MNANNQKIWILEDEEGTQYVYEQLLGHRYQLRLFNSIQAVQKAINDEKERPHLMIADLKSPDGNFLNSMDTFHSNHYFPFFVVSSLDDLDVLRKCYKGGAVDYITKPFGKSELIVKVERILEKEKKKNNDPFLNFNLDAAALRVRTPESKIIQLTPKEFHIFSQLFDNRGKIMEKKLIVKKVWGDVKVCSKTLDVHMFNLRKKIANAKLQIQYIPSDGFRLLLAKS